MEVAFKKTVRLTDGGKGLYITFKTPGQEPAHALSMRMRYRETEADAVARAVKLFGQSAL